MWQLNIINIIYLQCNLYYTICHPKSVCIRLLFAFYCLFTLSKSKFPFNCTLYREKFELFTPLVVTYQLLVLIVCRQNSWEDAAVPAERGRLRGPCSACRPVSPSPCPAPWWRGTTPTCSSLSRSVSPHSVDWRNVQEFDHSQYRDWMEDHWREVATWASSVYLLVIAGGQALMVDRSDNLQCHEIRLRFSLRAF